VVKAIIVDKEEIQSKQPTTEQQTMDYIKQLCCACRCEDKKEHFSTNHVHIT
jgi:hypothetical protein